MPPDPSRCEPDADGRRTVTGALDTSARTADLSILSVTNDAFPADLDAAGAAGPAASLMMPDTRSCAVAPVRRLLDASVTMIANRHRAHQGQNPRALAL